MEVGVQVLDLNEISSWLVYGSQFRRQNEKICAKINKIDEWKVDKNHKNYMLILV